MSKLMKRILIGVVIFVIIFFIIGMVVGNYFYNLALNPNSDKSIVLNAEHNKMGEEVDINPELEEIQKENQKWFDESGYEDVYVNSDDGLKLHGNYIKNSQETNQWAILFHGYGGYGQQMIYAAKRWYEMGYNILLPDARGLGESEGTYIGMGWDERLDALKWIDYIIKENPDAEIVLYGVSMGGATVMMISGEELPSNVKVIIEDCGYSSIWDEFAYQLKEIFNLPTFPVLNFASLVTNIRAGYNFSEGNAIEQVAKSKTPMMFIHGDEDTFVPSYMLDLVYDACNTDKEKIIVKGAGHGEAEAVMGEEYWTRIQSFINKY